MKVLFSLDKRFRKCGHLVIYKNEIGTYPDNHILCIKGKTICPDEYEANNIKKTGMYAYTHTDLNYGLNNLTPGRRVKIL